MAFGPVLALFHLGNQDLVPTEPCVCVLCCAGSPGFVVSKPEGLFQVNRSAAGRPTRGRRNQCPVEPCHLLLLHGLRQRQLSRGLHRHQRPSQWRPDVGSETCVTCHTPPERGSRGGQRIINFVLIARKSDTGNVLVICFWRWEISECLWGICYIVVICCSFLRADFFFV